MTADEVQVDDEAIREIAANYTREPGVRQLERLLAKALRKAATKLTGEDEPAIDGWAHRRRANLREFLGRPRFTPEAHERTSVPGVATGLAVTGLGGDVLFIEATAVDGKSTGSGKGGLTLTGQLGDVMKESAQIACPTSGRTPTCWASPTGRCFDRHIHIHVPAGAVPKDGPSAGVTMVTALTSMALGRPVRCEVGMTGEVTLNGRVLPDRRSEAEAARRSAGRSDHRLPAPAQRARPGRGAGRGAGGDRGGAQRPMSPNWCGGDRAGQQSSCDA